jgi:hypothetical protein
MRKTVYIHIGHYKTGTTALQMFLSLNRKRLLKSGVDYCSEMLIHAKHSQLAFSVYREAGVNTLMHGYNEPVSAQAVWERLMDYVEKSPAANVMVSTEEFMRMGAHPEAVSILKPIVQGCQEKVDFRVIAYLRAPGAHLRSWYNQLVKMRIVTADFNTAICGGIEPIHYDYAQALAPWIDILGEDSVFLRPYREDYRLGNGLFDDFLSIFGLKYDEGKGWEALERDPNPRLDDRLVELHRAARLAGLPDHRVEWIGHRAQKILTLQDEACAGQQQVFSEVVARARDGLAALEPLPGSALAGAGLDRKLPEPETDNVAELANVIAFLLREQHLHRTRLQESMAELELRQTELEAEIKRRFPSD